MTDKSSGRPSWDSIWMDLTKSISRRSTCKTPDRQVGCVIVDAANTGVLSMGYNGGAKGDDNDSCTYGKSSELVSRCSCAHAEMNALAKLPYTNSCLKTMYITLSPCDVCTNLIVNAGINRVVYLNDYKDNSGIFKLKRLGIECTKYSELGMQ